MDVSQKDRFKSRLQRWRIENGYTLEEVSDITGYSAAQLSRGERGDRGFSMEAKVLIARRLGVRVRDLFPVDEIIEDAG